jgi:hypothetical protein
VKKMDQSNNDNPYNRIVEDKPTRMHKQNADHGACANFKPGADKTGEKKGSVTGKGGNGLELLRSN